jgi:hypothetical protein
VSKANEHPKRLARVGAVLALLGSLIWVQWPLDIERMNFAGILLFLAAFVSWVAIEYAEFQADGKGIKADNIMSEDASKLNRLLVMITKQQFYILKHHTIETYIGDKDYSGLEDIIAYRDKDIFPFHNGDIQSKYQNFCALAEKFLHGLYGLYTSDGRGSMTWRSRRDDWVSDEIYAKVMTKITGLNGEASTLARLWEELIAAARNELKGASTSVEHYEL